MPTSNPKDFKAFSPEDEKKPQPDILATINFYLLPLVCIVISVLLLIFEILPTISDINSKSTQISNLNSKNNILSDSLAKTTKFYNTNASTINLSLELLNKVAPIEHGQLSDSKTLVEGFTAANSMKLTGFRSSENLRDIVSTTVANDLLSSSRYRVAVSELVTDGSLQGTLAFINNLYKSGKLYVIESLDLRSDTDTALPNVKNWNTRIVLAKYWFAEDFMQSQTKAELIQSASNSLDTAALSHLQSKIAQ